MFAQDISSVVVVDSTTRDDLHARAKLFVKTYSSECEESIDDKDYTISLRCKYPVKSMPSAQISEISFLFICESRDGRYRYKFSDIEFRIKVGTLTREKVYSIEEEKVKDISAKQWASVKDQTTKLINGMIRALEGKMVEKSDW